MPVSHNVKFENGKIVLTFNWVNPLSIHMPPEQAEKLKEDIGKVLILAKPFKKSETQKPKSETSTEALKPPKKKSDTWDVRPD